MKIKPSTQELMTTQSTLATLASEATELSKLLIECNGELTPELEKRLEVNTQLISQKVDSYNYIIEEFEAQSALWKRRKDACAAIEKRFSGQVERLWERIKLAIKEMGRTEIRGNLYRFQLQRSKPKLILEEEKIPNEFKMVVQMTVIDREKIELMLKEGFAIPGARFEESGTLRIYENSENDQ